MVSETARRLFSERGFEQVSIAEIAREAEGSEQTVFNYSPTKEDLVYSGLEAFEDQLLTAIRERPPGQTVIAAFGDFILEPRGLLAAKDDAAAGELMSVTRMIAASPALLAREQQILARYTDALAELIADETGSRAGDLRPYVVANALIGVHRALIGYVRERLDAGASDRRRPPAGYAGAARTRSRFSPTGSAATRPSDRKAIDDRPCDPSRGTHQAVRNRDCARRDRPRDPCPHRLRPARAEPRAATTRFIPPATTAADSTGPRLRPRSGTASGSSAGT